MREGLSRLSRKLEANRYAVAHGCGKGLEMVGCLEPSVSLHIGHIESNADFLNMVARILVLADTDDGGGKAKRLANFLAGKDSRNFWPGN